MPSLFSSLYFNRFVRYVKIITTHLCFFFTRLLSCLLQAFLNSCVLFSLVQPLLRTCLLKTCFLRWLVQVKTHTAHSTGSPCLVLFVVMPLLFHQPQCQKERENSTEQKTDQVRPEFRLRSQNGWFQEDQSCGKCRVFKVFV